jgi:dimethylglycine dehydrogenase
MRTQARVVVIGGGMMGASLLYHLALEGCTDAVLVEKDELTSGSTWHAAGQCPSIVGSFNLAKIHAYSNELYPRLEALTGQYTSWHPSGGLRLATNPGELAWLKYMLGFSKSVGFRMDIVGLDEIRRLNPFLIPSGVLAAGYTRDDGHGDPAGICNALAKAARDLGATVVRHNRVLAVNQRASGEWEVITQQGNITCEHVVNAAGCYAREVARMVGADAPITNMQHHYVITHPIQAFVERGGEIPVVRDSYSSGYLRQEQKSGLMGIYESEGLTEAWAPNGYPDWEASNELFADDLERIAPWLERAIERMPLFGEVGIRRVINGAIPHTPDSAPLLGPAPGLRNYWMCCGTSFGIAQGGGCGKYLAQWMIHGDAEINMAEFDPRRFGKFADKAYVREKVFQDYRNTYVTLLPGREEPAGRPSKTSPLYEKLEAQGCVHTETFGWERPKWFSLDRRREEPSYSRNNVFEVVAGEVAAVRDRVGILDLTGFAKYDIKGADAEAFLNRVCANRIPKRPGGIALVHILSENGRIQGEMTVTRLADDRFYALSAAVAELRDRDWLTQSIRPGERVQIDNVTEDRGVLVVSGPKARELLAPLTDAPLGNGDFPWLTAREIRIAGQADVRALRVSYVGELGWELHPPREAMPALYDALWERGRTLGLANYGLYAVNSMRMEKGYKAWSSELTNELNLLEADMPRFFAGVKEDFVGKAATLAAAPRPLKIAYVEVDASDSDARGGEPVLAGGRCIGVTTSGAYGHRTGKSLAFVCVDPQSAAPGGSFEILLQGEPRRATVLAGPAYDADNARMRG